MGTDNIRVHNREYLHLGMGRVGGVDIPESKLIEFSLQYVYGVGRNTAKQILIASGVNNKRTYELDENELQKRRFYAINIKRLKDIGSYRGRRHIAGLPVHGQRTKTNARTRKGKRKTVAGKKIAKK